VDEGRRVGLLDHHGAGELHTGRQRAAVVDRARAVAARLREVDRARRLRRRNGAGLERARGRLRDPADRGQAERDALDRLGFGAEPVGAVVLGVEARAQVAARRDHQLVALPDVAEVEPALERDPVARHALALERRGARGLELPVGRLDLGGVELVEPPQHRHGDVVHEVGRQQPGRREDPRARRDEHRREPGVSRDRVRVQRARAAERDEQEFARIVATVHRDQAERVHHRRVRDLDDAVRRLDRVQAERHGAALLDRALRAVDVEAELAAEEVAGIEPAEHEVGVRHRRLGAAPAVADRAGLGARAPRADAQQAAGVDPRDRAAAGADLDEVDHRRPHRIAREREAADAGGRVAAHEVVLRHRRLPAPDQPDLRGRAAHVEREQVAAADHAAEVRGGDHAGGRARLDHEHRPPPSGRRAEDAAARLHHEQLRLDTGVREPLLDPLEVALDDGPDDGVDHRRRCAQVLAELRRHLGGERDRHAGQLLGEDRADPQLVLRVDVGVQQADRDRLDLLASQHGRRVAHRALVERRHDLAARTEPLDDADGAVARHERPRLLELRVVQAGADLAGDLEQVAEPLRRHEAAARDPALDDRVRRHRRRMHDEGDGGDLRLPAGERTLDGRHEARGRVRRRRRCLRDRDPPGLLVDQRRVRERAADVDGHAHAHRPVPAAGALLTPRPRRPRTPGRR
jgi:hypothetical protein